MSISRARGEKVNRESATDVSACYFAAAGGLMKFTPFLLALVLSASAGAQGYPTHPITMVVPFPPGGVADIVGRPLAAVMQKSLKQPVVVVNRTGAGGVVGMAAVAKSAPDGYTLLMGLSSISIFPVSDRING